MSTTTESTPALRVVAALLGLSATAFALAGCGGSPANVDVADALDKVDVADVLAPQLPSVGIAADPGSLGCDSNGADQLSVGATITCRYTAGGQPVTLLAKVNAVDGSKVSFALDTQAAAVPAQTLASAVAARAGAALGVAITSAQCAGDLPPTQGGSTTCTLVNGASSRDVDVTVTSVDGGQITYSVAVK